MRQSEVFIVTDHTHMFLAFCIILFRYFYAKNSLVLKVQKVNFFSYCSFANLCFLWKLMTQMGHCGDAKHKLD